MKHVVSHYFKEEANLAAAPSEEKFPHQGIHYTDCHEPEFHGKPDALIPRFVGVEIEVDGTGAMQPNFYKLNQLVQKWHAYMDTDGSLSDGGFEMKTAPATGAVFYEQVKELCEELRSDRLRAYANSNCGLHNHVDVRELDEGNLPMIFESWVILQDMFYKMLPPQRRKNNYCYKIDDYNMPSFTPLHRARVKAEIEDDKTIVSTLQNSAIKRAAQKGCGINLSSWDYRSTIEFRIPPGSTNTNKIVGWAALFSQFVNWFDITSWAKKRRVLDMNHVDALREAIWTPEANSFIDIRHKEYAKLDV